MDNRKKDWGNRQNRLREILLQPEQFDEAIGLCLGQHAMVHRNAVSGTVEKTLEDDLWEGMSEKVFRTMLTAKDVTVAWGLWHLTRIEDGTVQMLVAGRDSVFEAGNWQKKLGVDFRDTGNAMSDEEILSLSRDLNMEEMSRYRVAVGQATRQIIREMTFEDLKRKIPMERVNRLFTEGVLLRKEGSSWLADFWGRKQVAGILLMPVTRHQLVHLNEAMSLKKRILKGGEKC